jgi:hypothetical protein
MLALDGVIQRFFSVARLETCASFSEAANNLFHSRNLVILFVVDLPLSLSIVQGLLLRLRECPVELTSYSGELASICTVAHNYADDDELYCRRRLFF